MQIIATDPTYAVAVRFPARPYRRYKVDDRLLDRGRHSDRDEGAYAIRHHNDRSDVLL
jgi:hypothetical protein